MTPSWDEALDELARTRGPELVRYAYVLCGDLAAAEDLVQEALVKVFVRTRSGTEPAVLEAYVRRTIATLSVDTHRRRRTAGGKRHLVAVGDVARDHAGGTGDRLDLRAALAGLGRQERTAVVLRYYDDLPLAEIAQVMGLASGSVKRYLHDGLKKLEATLGPIDTADDDDTVAVTTAQRTGRG